MAARKVSVPDIPGPKDELCWKQGTIDTPKYAMARCDRRKGHGGKHVWELCAEIDALEREKEQR
jgi:hypothetical protein